MYVCNMYIRAEFSSLITTRLGGKKKKPGACLIASGIKRKLRCRRWNLPFRPIERNNLAKPQRERKTIKKRRVIRARGCFTSPPRVIPATRRNYYFTAWITTRYAVRSFNHVMCFLSGNNRSCRSPRINGKIVRRLFRKDCEISRFFCSICDDNSAGI